MLPTGASNSPPVSAPAAVETDHHPSTSLSAIGPPHTSIQPTANQAMAAPSNHRRAAATRRSATTTTRGRLPSTQTDGPTTSSATSGGQLSAQYGRPEATRRPKNDRRSRSNAGTREDARSTSVSAPATPAMPVSFAGITTPADFGDGNPAPVATNQLQDLELGTSPINPSLPKPRPQLSELLRALDIWFDAVRDYEERVYGCTTESATFINQVFSTINMVALREKCGPSGPSRMMRYDHDGIWKRQLSRFSGSGLCAVYKAAGDLARAWCRSRPIAQDHDHPATRNLVIPTPPPLTCAVPHSRQSAQQSRIGQGMLEFDRTDHARISPYVGMAPGIMAPPLLQGPRMHQRHLAQRFSIPASGTFASNQVIFNAQQHSRSPGQNFSNVPPQHPTAQASLTVSSAALIPIGYNQHQQSSIGCRLQPQPGTSTVTGTAPQPGQVALPVETSPVVQLEHAAQPHTTNSNLHPQMNMLPIPSICDRKGKKRATTADDRDDVCEDERLSKRKKPEPVPPLAAQFPETLGFQVTSTSAVPGPPSQLVTPPLSEPSSPFGNIIEDLLPPGSSSDETRPTEVNAPLANAVNIYHKMSVAQSATLALYDRDSDYSTRYG